MSRQRVWVVLVALASLVSTACGAGAGTTGERADTTLRISAIPDHDPSELAAREEAMATYLAGVLDVDVEYVPVTDYSASVSLFHTGDLDVVFFGGLTGVQARLRSPGAVLLAQRDIDRSFRSVFIANAATGIGEMAEVSDLAVLRGRRFTFGSESSTSGRLMPEYFLAQAGVDSATDFSGNPGFSGSHDKTIRLVEAGSYEAGALNRQVWEERLKDGTVDLDKVVEVFTTPEYHDYHWVAGRGVEERFGGGFTARVRQALLALDGSTAEERKILDRYGAKALVPTRPADYEQVEEIARRLGLLS